MKDIQYLCRKFAWRFLKCNRDVMNNFFKMGGGKNGRQLSYKL